MKKKILTSVLAVMACLTLTACGSDEGKELKDMKLSRYLTLGEYTNIEISPVLKEVTEEDVEKQVQTYFIAECTQGDTDRPVANGDVANIDFAGFLNDVAFEGGTGTDYDLEIGSGTFIPGFEEQLIGVMPGEPVDLNLTFPTDYHSPDLAGQEVVFRVTVNYIVPEITDETVAALGNENYATAAEMEAYARTALEEAFEDDNYQTVVEVAMRKIIANTTFEEIPEFLIEEQKTNVEAQLAQTLNGTNIDADTYLQAFYGSSLQDIATENVKERLVIQAIANEAGIEITDEELDAQVAELAADYQVTNEQMLELMGMSRSYYREFMYAKEVYDYVYENTMVTEAE